MDDTKALIAEGRKALLYTSGGEISDLPERLAAALEAMELPEGWEASEYTNGYGNQVAGIQDEWNASHGGGEWLRDETGHKAAFSSAREAMAALDV